MRVSARSKPAAACKPFALSIQGVAFAISSTRTARRLVLRINPHAKSFDNRILQLLADYVCWFIIFTRTSYLLLYHLLEKCVALALASRYIGHPYLYVQCVGTKRIRTYNINKTCIVIRPCPSKDPDIYSALSVSITEMIQANTTWHHKWMLYNRIWMLPLTRSALKRCPKRLHIHFDKHKWLSFQHVGPQ